MKSLAILIGVPLVLWAVLLYPGYLIWGPDTLIHSSVALALCLVPAVATFVATCRLTSSTDQRMLASLGSSGLRMALVLGVGLLLYTKANDRFPTVFLYWLVVFYLVILGLEVGLLVRQSRVEGESASS